jgi:hypothetical protein
VDLNQRIGLAAPAISVAFSQLFTLLTARATEREIRNRTARVFEMVRNQIDHSLSKGNLIVDFNADGAVNSVDRLSAESTICFATWAGDLQSVYLLLASNLVTASLLLISNSPKWTILIPVLSALLSLVFLDMVVKRGDADEYQVEHPHWLSYGAFFSLGVSTVTAVLTILFSSGN